jgi:CheY-like chemotaxis protein
MPNQKLEKILVVDDDSDILEIVKLALATVGNFSIEACSSGKEALEKLAHIKPQLILLDVMMPDLDGPSTLKKIRENPELAQIPVIFLTAKVQAHEIEQFKKLGAVNVIPKPFDPMTLSETVASIWSETK